MKFKTLLVLASTSLLIFSNLSSAKAANSWVDCVIITKANIDKTYSSLPPSYNFTVSNGCSGSDIGSVKIEFQNGDILNYSYLNTQTIYSFSAYQYYGKKLSFSLKDMKPGYYQPSVKITAQKDYSRKTVSLPSYNIEAPKQPVLTSTGGNTSTLNSCAYTADMKILNCSSYPNWSISVCVSSSYTNAIVQQQDGTLWSDLWKVSTIYDSASCTLTTSPYLLVINGSSKLAVNKSASLRVLNDSKNLSILNFKVTSLQV